MKKNFLSVRMFALMVTTLFFATHPAFAKQGGPIVKEIRALSAFTKVSYVANVHVVMRKTASQKVEIEGERGALNLVKTEVVNGILNVSLMGQVNEEHALTIYISAPLFEDIKISGGGDNANRKEIHSNT